MFVFVVCVLAFIVPIAAALAGRGYRGVYLAVALFGIVAGLFCWMLPSTLPPGYRMDLWNAMPAAQRQGALIIAEYFRAIGAVLWIAAFGSVLGACLFRATTPRPVHVGPVQATDLDLRGTAWPSHRAWLAEPKPPAPVDLIAGDRSLS